MSKPLTKRQIIAICQIAAKAFKIMSPGLGDMTPEDFRHGEIFNVTGHTSLKTCTQRHYTPLYNHFAIMMGQQPKQDNTWDDRAKATHVLVDTLNRHELGLSYLVALARDRYHDRLSGYGSDVMIDAIRTKLTSREIMQLVYTINNRGRAKTTQFSNNLGLTDPITEPYADPSIMPPGTLANRYNATPTTPPDHDPS